MTAQPAVTMTSRRNPKALQISFQAKHRELALKKQAAARELGLLARRLAVVSDSSPSASGAQETEPSTTTSGWSERASGADEVSTAESGRGVGRPSRRSTHDEYAAAFMHPEWMLEAPADLATAWYVTPRPEGQRCLAIAAHGSTSLRLRNGMLHSRFSSPLPGGSPGTRQGEDCFCVLDCILEPAGHWLWVVDLLAWGGHSLQDCGFEFRLFWAASKLAEEVDQHSIEDGGSVPRFAALPWRPADPAGLRGAYADAAPFARDGLLFMHREAHYAPGQSPLSLVWKDAGCSRFPIDTDAQGQPLVEQRLVLEYRMDGTVATGDPEPCVLGVMPQGFGSSDGTAAAASPPQSTDGTGRPQPSRSSRRAIVPGALLRFALGPGGFVLHGGRPVGADLRYLGPVSARRGRPDPLSKILFQHMARTVPLGLPTLLQAAGEG